MSTSTKSLEKEKIHHENLKPGYIYKTPGNVSSLFVGHVSTLKLEARMLLDDQVTVLDSDFIDKKKSVSITEKTRSFRQFRIVTKYIEYGTLWYNFSSLNNWLIKHPDLTSTESVSEIEKYIVPSSINLYDYSIRSKVSFNEVLVDHKFSVPFESLYLTIRDKAGSNIKRRQAYFEHFQAEKLSAKIANSNICLLANMSPLGVYPQLNSCFFGWNDMIINKKTK